MPYAHAPADAEVCNYVAISQKCLNRGPTDGERVNSSNIFRIVQLFVWFRTAHSCFPNEVQHNAIYGTATTPPMSLTGNLINYIHKQFITLYEILIGCNSLGQNNIELGMRKMLVLCKRRQNELHYLTCATSHVFTIRYADIFIYAL